MSQEVQADWRGFWRSKRVLLTGHTGFKGGWLTIWLHHLGARVTGISLPPETSPNLYALATIEKLCESHFCDIRDAGALAAIVKQAQPEIVFHLAAQPLVRASYQHPLATFSVNIMGTAYVLEALRGLGSVRAAVMVSTDKVYRDNEGSRPYLEDDPLGGHDPYSASKAAGEIVIDSYRKAFLAAEGIAVASARAGNVIGGGDWSEDRLIPDAIRAWQAGMALSIRQPASVRPWQHVLEPLSAYLQLARQLCDSPNLAGAYNFGPAAEDAVPVKTVVSLAQRAYGGGTVQIAVPPENLHEAGRLELETARARDVLGIKPRWSVEQAIERTMSWYRAQADGADARELCLADISRFEAGA